MWDDRAMKLDQAVLRKIIDIAEQKRALECDGLTRAISYVLTSEEIKHNTVAGNLYRPDTGEVIESHVWIEVGDRILDFRARMWLGNSEAIPHGLFDPKDYTVTYEGCEVSMATSDSVFSILMAVGS